MRMGVLALLLALLASMLVGCDRLSRQTSSPPGGGTGGAGVQARPAPVQPEPAVDVVEKVRPSVVHIQVKGIQIDLFGRQIPEQGVGTGVILDRNGHILTNNHVVTMGGNRIADEVIVSLTDGRTFDARVIGRDPQTDLAVVKISADSLVPATIGDSRALKVGQQVWAIGHALNLQGGPTVTRGVVSAKNRSVNINGMTLGGLIQTDAAINPGNSGGPLVTDAGEVIGINTLAAQAQDIGFAIASETFQPIAAQLIEKGRVERGFLGISFQDVTPALARNLGLDVQQGVVVMDIVRGGPAAQAGIRPGDVIISIAGQPIRNAADLTTVLRQYKPGERVQVGFIRGGRQQSVEVRLGEPPRV